jgi:hypothetical protein
MPTSTTIDRTLRDIYADADVSSEEIIRLRKEVDRAEQRILDEEGLQGIASALFKSFDVTRQLLQESLLRFENGEYSDTGREMVGSALEANIRLLQANVDAFRR